MDEKPHQGDTCSKTTLSTSSSWSVTIVWAVFLACSWTWVIGMYLPVLLRDRYGWWGVLAFAIPNIVGIMMFGWGIKTINHSRAFLKKHHLMTLAFSAVTVAFHAWFFGWFWSAELALHPGYGILIGLVFISIAVITAGLSDRLFLWISAAVYGISILVFIITVTQGWTILTGRTPSPRILYWPSASANAWFFLIPVMAIGFLACPYFDLTFHRAYQSVGGGKSGRTTFLLFGPLFAVMIALTAVYTLTGFSTLIIIHLLLQGWLTTTLHIKEIIKHTKPYREDELARRLLQIPYIIVFLASFPLIDYRDWFIFYGIIFPAIYLLSTMRIKNRRREAQDLTIYAVILFSIPFAMAGFLADHEWALAIPPLAILIMSFLGGKKLTSIH